MAAESFRSAPRIDRSVVVAGGVVLLHVAALWTLQTGLLRSAVEVFLPVEVLSEVITSPRPKVATPPPESVKPPVLRQIKPTVPNAARSPAPIDQPTVQEIAPTPSTPPTPLAITDTERAPNAPVGQVAPQPVAAAPAAVATAPAPPLKVELPASDADYLQNPKVAYPLASKRLGEQGRVVVRVLIGADGAAHRAEVRQSSGFARLDEAALATVLKWRYVPGKRGGVAETMWFNVPINFVLE
ncbi:MAG: energy transducer TonB [Proteobacteria bacterium]|nr:energy transducer TonB [Burkholderiales bacterium]